MAVLGMEHFTVLAEDLDATRAFYRDILGLEEGYRPPLGFPGAWLYVGGRAILYVIAGRALPENRAGVLDHMAFAANAIWSRTPARFSGRPRPAMTWSTARPPT